MELTIIPRMSEKTVGMSAEGIYVFNVPTTANKAQVAEAVTKQYGVKVVDVNVIIAKGKVTRRYRKNGRATIGHRNDVKKAYVRLAEGDKIAAFEQATEAASKETK